MCGAKLFAAKGSNSVLFSVLLIETTLYVVMSFPWRSPFKMLFCDGAEVCFTGGVMSVVLLVPFRLLLLNLSLKSVHIYIYAGTGGIWKCQMDF